MKTLNTLDNITGALMTIGGINWGLWGILKFDLVSKIFRGDTRKTSRVVYTLVGISALYQAVTKGYAKRHPVANFIRSGFKLAA